MRKAAIYKTVLTIEVLSDEPLDPQMSTSDVVRDMIFGTTSGITKRSSPKLLKGKHAVKEIHKHGTDPSFFFMDENGNELTTL